MESWDNLGSVIAALITASGGAAGLALVINAWAARRAAVNTSGLDLRRATDAASAALIQDLQRHRLECEERLAAMDKRLDMVERLIPVLKVRDAILQQAITDLGLTVPRLPAVHWPDGK